MVNHCSNPNCCKPLHYLREGRIYVFDVPDTTSPAAKNGLYPRHMEHFWLCGPCSSKYFLERSAEVGIRVVPKAGNQRREPARVVSTVLAS